jgi:hypothetical protein
MTVRWLGRALGTLVLLGLADCSCGVGADPDGTSNAAGSVSSDGSVHFTSIRSGTAESFPIPVKESADTSETIESASISGSGASAFQLVSQFPIEVPNGRDATVEVKFAPSAAGTTFEAVLLLETAKMGTSQISLAGTSL